ncbi:MAG TPA: hypothetical protein VF179_11855 [Thermoanaerobaculia bacterium]|nr:hypothetical protein [Thermoanaerobaculia bacterium]
MHREDGQWRAVQLYVETAKQLLRNTQVSRAGEEGSQDAQDRAKICRSKETCIKNVGCHMVEDIVDIELGPRIERLISLIEVACDSASKQYDDYYKTFAALDGKAQSTATVSGVVLASVIAFVNAGRLSPLLSSTGVFGYLLVISPAVGALIAVIISLLASKVVKVSVPFSADVQIKEVEDLIDLPAQELSGDHVLSFYQSRLSHCEKSLANMAAGVGKKARLVFWAQVLLVSTLFILLTFFIAMVVTIPTKSAVSAEYNRPSPNQPIERTEEPPLIGRPGSPPVARANHEER